MITYDMDVNQYFVLVGFINIILFLSIYFYNKREQNSKLQLSLAIIYTLIQTIYRFFLYYFKSIGIVATVSKFNLAHLYYTSIPFMIISLVACFIMTYFIMKMAQKNRGNINYLGILLILIGFYTGVL
ncbi:MAG: hypothetical protein JXQ23_13650 [Clostridia bacterium]|nr:hypothetical protein [Clostridia bacterium]